MTPSNAPKFTKLRGRLLMEEPLLNKGTAFNSDERTDLGLRGLLPPYVTTLEEQIARLYGEFSAKGTDLEKHTFLRNVQDENETLFYALLLRHISEMTPIVYTPTVGEACQNFGKIFRRPRGLYFSYPNKERIDEIFDNVHEDVDVIVVTDGGRILGLGDQGAGGMGIPIGKLSLYSLCGGIDPARTLPILLDVGTNNEERLADPRYLGWRNHRITGTEYDDFVECFVRAAIRRFPKVLLQWEDFSSDKAEVLRSRYENRLCSFNDDIQGTAASTVGTLLSAVSVTREPLEDQIFVMLGAGSAGFGNYSLLVRCLVSKGLTELEARARIFVVDSKGLLHDGRENMTGLKAHMLQPRANLSSWDFDVDQKHSALDVVRNAHPTAIIGATGQPNTFTKEIVTLMAKQTERPIFMPLSNPTSKAEATPADLLEWTAGKALIATGSPFDPVQSGGRLHTISQANNVYIFPAIGLGVLSANAVRVTEGMFLAAALTLGEASPAKADPDAPLLPPLNEIRNLTKTIALAVAKQARDEGLADRVSDAELKARIDDRMWEPVYQPLGAC
ncbi:MAG: malate dehydrogenase (oxaloacetate-decarboxylating) [Bacteroidia bacterium]|jgi:malate dehydrogenase (oxaloacetate-decarboxylating)